MKFLFCRCPPNGIYHLGICAKESPIFLSHPHFLHADSSLRNQVNGLAPSESDHEFFFDFDKVREDPLKLHTL